MPKGYHYTADFRNISYENNVLRGNPPEFIFQNCLTQTNPESRISVNYLGRVCRDLHNPAFAAEYCLGPKPRQGAAGASKKLDAFEESVIMDLVEAHPTAHLATLINFYYQAYYGDVIAANPGALLPAEHRISTKIIGRLIHDNGWSKVAGEYRHINTDPTLGYEYLMSVAHVDPNYLVDIDETGTDLDDFGCSRGYSKVGEKYIRTQFVVRGKHYTAIAAACCRGFLSWRIFDGPVTDEQFIEFLNEMEASLDENSYGIIDNAAIHKTAAARTRLDEVFNGFYSLCAPYHFFLKPIEKNVLSNQSLDRQEGNEFPCRF